MVELWAVDGLLVETHGGSGLHVATGAKSSKHRASEGLQGLPRHVCVLSAVDSHLHVFLGQRTVKQPSAQGQTSDGRQEAGDLVHVGREGGSNLTCGYRSMGSKVPLPQLSPPTSGGGESEGLPRAHRDLPAQGTEVSVEEALSPA